MKMASPTGSSPSSSRAQTSTRRSTASSTHPRYRRKVVFLWIVFPIITVGPMIALDDLLGAARGLANAARWEQATGLLDTAAAGLPRDEPGTPEAAARLALAAA